MKTLHTCAVLRWAAAAVLCPLLSRGQVPGMAVDQQNDNFGYYYLDVYSGWQSFTAGTNGHLGAVELWLYSTGGGSGHAGGTNWSATLSIYAGQGPAGAPLVSQPITGDGTLQKRTFVLAQLVRQTNGSLYTIAFSGATTGLTIRTSANVYTNGRCGFSSSYDHNFSTWVLASEWSEEAYRDTNFTASATTINNEAQMAQFAWLVNNGNTYDGETVTLAADLNLAAHYWTPMGAGIGAFRGTFDGGGHAIRSLVIDKSGTDYQGFFGYASGPIRNLALLGVDISGRNNVGAFAGYAGGPIANSSVEGAVSGLNTVGGVAGLAASSIGACVVSGRVSGASGVGGVAGESYGLISSCRNESRVTGANYLGGVVGLAYDMIRGCTNGGAVASTGGERAGGMAGISSGGIDDCRNSGSISAPSLVGGIAGEATERVNHCLNSGAVTGSYAVGGLIGYLNNPTLWNSLNRGAVTADQLVGGLVGDGQGSVVNCGNTGAVSGTNRVGGLAGRLSDPAMAYNGVNSGPVSGTNRTGGLVGDNSRPMENCYWKRTGTAPYNLDATGANSGTLTNVLSFAAAPGTLTAPVTVGDVTTNGLAAVLKAWVDKMWIADLPLRRWTRGSADAYPEPIFSLWSDSGNFDTNWYDGAAAQFHIGTAAELAGLAVLVNGGHDFSNKTVTLTADIDLADREWNDIGYITGMGWGTRAEPFRGTFEGNGRTVRGVYIDVVRPRYAGFFGYVSGATIRNLMLSDLNIANWAPAGGVGILVESACQNCRCDGFVYGQLGAGGLVLVNAGIIENSFCSAMVVSTGLVGSLVGDNESVISNGYWKYTGTAPFDVAAVGVGNVAEDSRSFGDAPGTLASPITVGGLTTSNLSAALNAWVDARQAVSPGLYNWTAGSTARYPMLAPVIRVGGTPIPQTLGDTFAVGTTLEQATNTVAAYTNAHPGTTAASFGNVMCLAEAMGFRFADLAIGSNILNFNPGVTLTGFRPAPWTLTFRVGNGIDATAVLAMNRLAGSAAKELTVIGRPEPDGSETGFVPAVQYGADGTATAVFGPPGMSATGFFRLQLEHASPPP